MEFLTCLETANLLRIDYAGLTRMAKRGKIPCARIGRKYLFSLEVLEAWLANGGTAQAPEPPEPMEPFAGAKGNIASRIRKIRA